MTSGRAAAPYNVISFPIKQPVFASEILKTSRNNQVAVGFLRVKTLHKGEALLGRFKKATKFSKTSLN